MAREHIPRGSKTKAIASITTTIQTLNTMEQMNNPEEHQEPAQVFRIPAHIWNAYIPPKPPLPLREQLPRQLKLRLKFTTSPPRSPIRKRVTSSPSPRQHFSPSIQDPISPIKRRRTWTRSCKVKLWRFQYGGSAKQMHGKSKNAVTLEKPCLKKGCANCWKWHRHLMEGGSKELEDSEEKEASSEEGNGSGEIGSEGDDGNRGIAQPVAESAKRRQSDPLGLEAATLQDGRVITLAFRTQDGRRRYEDLIGRKPHSEKTNEKELERKGQPVLN